MSDANVRWLAIESNPEVMTQLAQSLGLPETYGFSDVFGFEPDLLAMVPKPCHGVILLRGMGVEVQGTNCSGPFFIAQHEALGNACGTIAMIHAMSNAAEKVGIPSESPLVSFISHSRNSTSTERGHALEKNEAIRTLHNKCAQEGQTAVIAGEVEYHFVCFVDYNGRLVELDGLQAAPIDRGAIGTDETVLEAAARFIQAQYATVDGNLSMIAFGALGSD